MCITEKNELFEIQNFTFDFKNEQRYSKVKLKMQVDLQNKIKSSKVKLKMKVDLQNKIKSSIVTLISNHIYHFGSKNQNDISYLKLKTHQRFQFLRKV